MNTHPLTILIVEDHPVFRQGLRQVIEQQEGFRILHEASDGANALKLALELKPHIILLDIDLPGMNGLEVLRALKHHKVNTSVVCLTMHKAEDIFNEAINLGAYGYVLKDSAVQDILTAIKTVTAGHRYISPALTDCLFARGLRTRQLHERKPGIDQLTPTERRILKQIADDKTSKEIADDMGLSPRTVENHRANICIKLNLHGSHSLLKFAFENKSQL